MTRLSASVPRTIDEIEAFMRVPTSAFQRRCTLTASATLVGSLRATRSTGRFWRLRQDRRRSIGPVGTRLARPAYLVLLLVIALCGTLRADTKSFVWKATSKQGRMVYLAGSVHLLSARYYPLSPAFDTAFNASDLLVEEVDMAEMLAPDSQLMMLTRGMMPAGQSLDKVLSPATYAAVNARVTALGLPMAPLNLFKPWALALTLAGAGVAEGRVQRRSWASTSTSMTWPRPPGSGPRGSKRWSSRCHGSTRCRWLCRSDCSPRH